MLWPVFLSKYFKYLNFQISKFPLLPHLLSQLPEATLKLVMSVEDGCWYFSCSQNSRWQIHVLQSKLAFYKKKCNSLLLDWSIGNATCISIFVNKNIECQIPRLSEWSDWFTTFFRLLNMFIMVLATTASQNHRVI